MAKARLDISGRSDVACLVNVFYDRVCADDMLGLQFQPQGRTVIPDCLSYTRLQRSGAQAHQI